MIFLLLALLRTPEPPLTELQIWEREILCTEAGACRPRVVRLGPWDPCPAPSKWDRTVFAPAKASH